MPDSLTSALMVAFDGGRLTSDGGLVWLAQADDQLDLSAAFSRQMRDWRRGPVHHPLRLLVRQRLLQIACGYEDQDDADTLRHDPLLKLVCGRLPEHGADLASQPTLSRLENAVDRRTCYRLAQTLVAVYLQERERGGVPDHVLLDLDGTDDPTHGEQEGSSYHGYYRQHRYHPLLIFDGHTNHLITAVLRHGTVHASHGVVAILRRLVTAMRRRWPAVRIELRADSGFAIPALYDYCEREHLDDTIGLAPNTRLQALAAPLVEQAAQQHTATGAKVRLAGEGQYAAGSWAHERRVVSKAEELEKGRNLRFVVTSRTDLDPLALYNWYVRRGEPELWIKDPERRLLRRSPELPSLLGQPVPPLAARGRLLAARYAAPLAHGSWHGSHATGHGADPRDQDRRLGPRASARSADLPAPPRQQSPRRAALASARRPLHPP